MVDLENPNAWGDVEHVVWCNADRKKPVGCEMCSCPTGRELRTLRAEVARLRGLLEKAAEMMHEACGKEWGEWHDTVVELRAAAKGGET